MTLPRPCLDCGVPAAESRCEACSVVAARQAPPKAQTTAQRGYGSAWQRLSARARALQPWCTDCGTRQGLTTDHVVPLALGGKRTGLTLRDVAVVCVRCNVARYVALRRAPRSAASSRTTPQVTEREQRTSNRGGDPTPGGRVTRGGSRDAGYSPESILVTASRGDAP